MSRYKLGDITVNNWNDWDRVPRDPVTIGVMITQGLGYGAATGLLAAGTLTTGAYLLSAAVGYLAVGAVTSWAYKALAPKPDFGAMTSAQSMSNSIDAISAQEFVYGKVRKGGVVTFYETSGTTDAPQKYLHQIIVLAGHEVNSIGNIYINDKVASFSGNFVTTATDGTTTDDWGSKIRIKKHDGSQTAVDSDLQSDTSVGTSFIGKGIAYLYVRYEFDQDVFTQGVPVITAIVEGKKVFDPVTNSTAYSANAALCVRDFLVSSYGLADSSIDDVSFAAARNESNETVALSGGGTEKRYEINGIVQANRPIGDVLEDMCTACAGTLFWGSGYWKLKVGAYTSPVKTLDMDDLRGPIQLETRLSMRDNFNKVSGTFNDAAQDWITADYPIITSSTDAGSFVTNSTYAITELGNTNWNTAAGTTGVTYAVGDVFTASNAGSGTGKASLFLGQDNGEEALLDLSLPFTTSAAMAQRLAKMTLFRGREQMTLTADFSLAALEVEVGDIIGFTNPRYGFSAKQFEVIGWKFSANGEAGDLRVNLALRETSAAAFNWNAEETAIVSNDTTLPSLSSGTAVTGLSVSDGGSSVQTDGTIVNSLLASWTAPTNSFVSSYEIEWGQTSSANRTTFVSDTTSALLSPVVDGVSYTVRVRSVSVSGFRGPYSSATGTSGGDTTAPSVPTSVTAAGGYKYITISWTNPANADLSHVEIYENSTNTTTGASVVGTASGNRFVRTNLGLAQTKYYFLKAVDFSGNKSGFSSGASAETDYIDNNDFENGVRQLFLDQNLDIIAPVSSLPSSGAFTGQQVFLTTTGKLYRWSGSAWVLTLAAADGGDITDATITGNKVVANTITGGLLATSGIITSSAQMDNAVISTAKIGDLQVDRIKIADNAVSVTATDTVVNNTITPNQGIAFNPQPASFLTNTNFAAVGGITNLTRATIQFHPHPSQLVANGTGARFGVYILITVGTTTLAEVINFVERSNVSSVNTGGTVFNAFTAYQYIGTEAVSFVCPWVSSTSATYTVEMKISSGYFTSTGAWGSQTLGGTFDGALETGFLAK